MATPRASRTRAKAARTSHAWVTPRPAPHLLTKQRMTTAASPPRLCTASRISRPLPSSTVMLRPRRASRTASVRRARDPSSVPSGSHGRGAGTRWPLRPPSRVQMAGQGGRGRGGDRGAELLGLGGRGVQGVVGGQRPDLHRQRHHERQQHHGHGGRHQDGQPPPH